jgi:hypothetical protein
MLVDSIPEVLSAVDAHPGRTVEKEGGTRKSSRRTRKSETATNGFQVAIGLKLLGVIFRACLDNSQG